MSLSIDYHTHSGTVVIGPVSAGVEDELDDFARDQVDHAPKDVGISYIASDDGCTVTFTVDWLTDDPKARTRALRWATRALEDADHEFELGQATA